MSRTARSAVAALVLAVPVVAEVARPDLFGSVAGHLVGAASQVLGWGLLASVVADAPDAARVASPRGRRVVLAACALQVLFGLAYGATALDGEPFEGVFVFFLLGFFALLVGGPLWAGRLRRLPGARAAVTGLLSVAVLGTLAVLVEPDPFHDIALVGAYLAWVLVGHGLTRLEHSTSRHQGQAAADETAPVRSDAG